MDTTQNLTSVSISAGSPATATVGTGVTMDTLTGTIAAAGYGFCAIPAPGDITVGGALAINAHGSAIPANGETMLSGQTYGSLSNLILSLTAVVWDSSAGQYVLKTFQRSDPDIRAFLAHLGRAFVTSVTLQLAASQNLRCQSWVDISAADLFAPPASAGIQFVRQLCGRSRPRRGDLVPVHRHTVAEGMEDLPGPAAVFGGGDQSVQLHVHERRDRRGEHLL